MRYTTAMSLMVSLCFAVSYVSAEIPRPSAVRCVQVAALHTSKEADEFAESLRARDFGPVWTREEKGTVRVLVGRCERLPDALILRNSLRAGGYSDAYTRAYRDLAGENLIPEMLTPDRPLLLSSEDTSGVYSDDDIRLNADVTGLLKALDDGANPEVLALVKELIRALPDDDPLKGRMIVQASRSMIREDRTEEAISLLLSMAQGKIAATEGDRLDARWLVADSWHYYEFKPLLAYQAYSEIAGYYGGSDHGIHARALVEIQACLMELAQMKQAYYNEVQRIHHQITETIPPQYERAHAVSDLMYCESFMFEGNKQKALELLADFELRHPRRIREISMATHMRGCILAEMGQWQEAADSFEKNLRLAPLDPKECFYWEGKPLDIKLLSARWAWAYAERSGDNARAYRYKTTIETARKEQKSLVFTSNSFDTIFPHLFYEWTSDDERRHSTDSE